MHFHTCWLENWIIAKCALTCVYILFYKLKRSKRAENRQNENAGGSRRQKIALKPQPNLTHLLEMPLQMESGATLNMSKP